MVRAKIDAAYAESVKFAPEVDAFDEAISAAVKVYRCMYMYYVCVCVFVYMKYVYMWVGPRSPTTLRYSNTNFNHQPHGQKKLSHHPPSHTHQPHGPPKKP